MATYFSSSSNQRDDMPTIYTRDPASVSYAEAPDLSRNMMMYLNQSSTSTSYSDTLAGNSQMSHNCVDLPSIGTLDSNSSEQGILSNIVGSHIGDQTYSVWRDGRNEMLFMQPMGGSTSMQPITGQTNNSTDDPVCSSVTEDPQMGLQTQLGILPSRENFQGQGLSLSLSTDMPSSSANTKQMYSDPSYSAPDFTSTIPSSKYLKVAQELLDEVVNVQKALKQHESNKRQSFQRFGVNLSKEADRGLTNNSALSPTSGAPSNPQESGTNPASDLSPTERQDMQNKMAKLVPMLDEVDRRYKQYYHHMHIVVSSFDLIAGSGASKPYTALALQVISHHFRCLRDAISGQIKTTRRSLGEQDSAGNSAGVGISRLRLVDQQLRQQRNLQHLGMMQQHAWRPQRGLPESSVSILRAWLFEHFLHPYPKDSDKLMLARQAGLTRSQVSNWFINARVRLWKPMVEEMYKEETHDTEMESNSSPDNNTTKLAREEFRVSEDRGGNLLHNPRSAATERYLPGQFHEPQSNLDPGVNRSCSTAGASFHNRTHGEDDTDYMGIKLREDQRPHMNDCNLLQDAFIQSAGSSNERFMDTATAYQMAELGRFGSGSGVSLTLGLQHCDRGGLSMSGRTHHNFVAMRGNEMYNPETSSMGTTDTGDYNCVDAGSVEHRFGSSHLLHDFVP